MRSHRRGRDPRLPTGSRRVVGESARRRLRLRARHCGARCSRPVRTRAAEPSRARTARRGRRAAPRRSCARRRARARHRDRHFGRFATVGGPRGAPLPTQPIILGAQCGILGLQRPRAALEGGHGLAERVDRHRLAPALRLQPLRQRGEPEPSDEARVRPLADAIWSDFIAAASSDPPTDPGQPPQPTESPLMGWEAPDTPRPRRTSGRAASGHSSP